MSTKITNYSLIIAAILFIFVIGYSIGVNTGFMPAQNKGYQSGWDAAKKRLEQTGYAPQTSANIEIKNVIGRVVAINDNTIQIAIRPAEPLADPDLDQRIASVDKNTVFIRLIKRDEKKLADEAKANEAISKDASGKDIALAPQMFEQKPITLSDIKAGDRVIAASTKDIKSEKVFLAQNIMVINEAQDFETGQPAIVR
jgi:hypothetical protein